MHTLHHVKNQEYEFFSDTAVYTLKQTQEYEHTNGNGGHWLYESSLFNKNNPDEKLLESKLYMPWSTDSDDRTDYGNTTTKYTTLYQKDEFARVVFENAKKVSGEENEPHLVRLLLGGI